MQDRAGLSPAILPRESGGFQTLGRTLIGAWLWMHRDEYLP
jgi:hypothetical protein